MSKLLVEELEATTLSQSFTILNRLALSAVRPLLYLHNDPTGTFTLTIKNGSETVTSASLTGAQIISNAGFTAGQYHYGFFKFDMSAILNIDTTYTLELSSSGYTFSEASYLGWIREHENNTNSIDGTITSSLSNPLSYQLWGYKG